MEKGIWICIEKAERNYAAYAPEVPGCIATGKTIEQTRQSMCEALAFHFEGMVEDGESLDGITGAFPLESLAGPGNEDDYWTLVKIEVPETAAARS